MNQTDWINPAFQPALVSVVIPTYNRARLVVRAIKSVLEQTYRPLEILLVDDGSTDNTEAVVGALAQRGGPGISLRYLKQANAGAPAARNRGCAESRGEYVQFLDSDDFLAPPKIALQAAALRENPNPLCSAYGPWRTYYQDSFLKNGPLRQTGPYPRERMVPDTLLGYWNCPPLALLHKRRAVVEAGPWDTARPNGDDVDYRLRVLLAGSEFIYVPGALVFYVDHSESRLIHSLNQELLSRCRDIASNLKKWDALTQGRYREGILRLLQKLRFEAHMQGSQPCIETCEELAGHLGGNIATPIGRPARFKHALRSGISGFSRKLFGACLWDWISAVRDWI